jgi:hypothetical protein
VKEGFLASRVDKDVSARQPGEAGNATEREKNSLNWLFAAVQRHQLQ